MSDRPTPETDYEEEIDNGDTVPSFKFARKLERQRDEARELARELRDAMKAITPYIGYPSTPTDVVYQFRNALTKAKEVLP